MRAFEIIGTTLAGGAIGTYAAAWVCDLRRTDYDFSPLFILPMGAIVGGLVGVVVGAVVFT